MGTPEILCHQHTSPPPWRHAETASVLKAARLLAKASRCLGRYGGRRLPVEERAIEEMPDSIPRIDLLGVVVRLPRQAVHLSIERVPAERMVVHLRDRKPGLARPERVDERHVLVDLDVLIVTHD